MVEKSLVSRQEAKIRELETKLEFEKTQVKRLEVRAKDRCRSAGGACGGRCLGEEAPACGRHGNRLVGRCNVLLGSEINCRDKGQDE